MQLPSLMSKFKSDSLFYEAHASDADYRKISGDTTFAAEYYRHYLDIDEYPNSYQPGKYLVHKLTDRLLNRFYRKNNR